MAYWHYPLFLSVGEKRKEPDILMLHQAEGVIVIEVKALTIDNIHSIEGHQWKYNNFYQDSGNPYEQAESHLFSFLSLCDREPTLRRRVRGRAVVALPNITRQQWASKGFSDLVCCPPVMLKEDFQDSFRGALLEQEPVQSGNPLDDGKWQRLCGIAGNISALKPQPKPAPDVVVTKADAIAKASHVIAQFDQDQEEAAKQIPEGPQRIRGIAGSGKTVLLCQKAAQMHLKHPDWDIALVFFTRSLYTTIIEWVDRYIRQFTNGDQGYCPETSRLRVLHAWGAKDQPGLYSEVCLTEGCQKLTPGQLPHATPTVKLGLAINELYDSLRRQNKTVTPQFDALLIDEGQDLVVAEEFKTHGVQPFYWMAYQACKPIHVPETGDLFDSPDATPQRQDLRRLIWAYDEAQCLDSPTIPKAREVFGDEYAHLLQGQYEGNIRRSIVMHRCYRTPGPILTAAHAIGMGLLREEGMISGVTRQSEWQDLGYKVQGTFTQHQQILLERPSENSPNPMPEVSPHPSLTFERYSNRQQEAATVAKKIRKDIEEGLTPEKQLLVVVFDPESQRSILEALTQEGVDYYLPSALSSNNPETRWPNNAPNQFWHKGAVTVSHIHRAKGNEAEMVYVMGLDIIAENEDDFSMRNKLFVAMTRAKGWLHLSGGDQDYRLYRELKEVMESNGRYEFTFRKAPKRDLSDA